MPSADSLIFQNENFVFNQMSKILLWSYTDLVIVQFYNLIGTNCKWKPHYSDQDLLLSANGIYFIII